MATLINLPKMGDYGNMMVRGALKNKVAIASETSPPSDVAGRLACPNITLRLPSIAPSPGPEVLLMVEGAKELGQKIAVQQRVGERFNQEVQKQRTLQLEAPRNAMEEYFLTMLKNLRRKEIEEANNAYLTPQQKEMLAQDALRVKASMPGGLVQRADELAQRDIALDEQDAQDDAEAMAEDARLMEQLPASTADPGDVATAAGAPTPINVDEVGESMGSLFDNVAALYKQTQEETAGRVNELTAPQVDRTVSSFRKALSPYRGKGLTANEINVAAKKLRRALSGQTTMFRNNPMSYLDGIRIDVMNALQRRLLEQPAAAAAAASSSSSSSSAANVRRFFS